MGRKTVIAAIAAVLLAAALVAGALPYDRSQEGKIADGVTIDGIDVGGMDADEAEAKVRRALLRPLDRPLRTVYRERTWALPAAKLKVRADIGAAVEQAVALSREGDLPTRLGRYLGGDELEVEISAELAYSRSAVNRFVRHVAADLDREARRRLGAARLRRARSRRLAAGPQAARRPPHPASCAKRSSAAGPARSAPASTRPPRRSPPRRSPRATRPTSPSTARNFTLRLWKDLELARTYTVAVGQEGLETPEGLYAIEAKEENPTWHVPESDWAGDLAGQTIPPGPSNPIKARWMAIYEGAGIHGTEETAIARQRRLARMRPDVDPRRGRALRPRLK